MGYVFKILILLPVDYNIYGAHELLTEIDFMWYAKMFFIRLMNTVLFIDVFSKYGWNQIKKIKNAVEVNQCTKCRKNVPDRGREFLKNLNIFLKTLT